MAKVPKKVTRRKNPEPRSDAPKRSYVSQSDVPSCSLEEALVVPQAICDDLGKLPAKPLRVAESLDLAPAGERFRNLCGAAMAYGLINGGYNAAEIGLELLGKRIAAPTVEGDDTAAKREAILRPRVMREFLSRYRNSRLPQDRIARHVLEEIGVPTDRTERTYELIKENAQAAGVLREMKGGMYVDLDATVEAIKGEPQASGDVNEQADSVAEDEVKADHPPVMSIGNRRVFIAHGKNKRLVEPLKDLLSFGEYEPVVCTERESVSKPVPDKVMDDMRSCTAAIIHVDKEQELIDTDGDRHTVLNPNVLIEIGAAMALYGRRFILLVREGVSLPSNLQGLYQVRYQDDALDAEATIRVLKALKDIKNHALPNFTSGLVDSEE